jgi:FeS assembly SUF system protein
MLTPKELEQIDDDVIRALKSCYDPEIPVNIYELGLIYQVRVRADGRVTIRMTLTSPNCPAAQSLPEEIQQKVEGVHLVTGVEIDIVWDPPWSMAMMSEAARLRLGFM